MFSLACTFQQYHWGERGDKSLVCRLLQGNRTDLTGPWTHPGEMPFAELWMGAHPSGDSLVLSQSTTPQSSSDTSARSEPLSLRSLLSQNKELGDLISGRQMITVRGDSADSPVPFLFKVLSVRLPLSIQIHPDKIKAKELRQNFPNLYPDSNHKPEMAIALSKFECLCGFRPARKISTAFQEVAEFGELIGSEPRKNFIAVALSPPTFESKYWFAQCSELLRICYTALMTAPKEKVDAALHQLVARLSAKPEEERSDDEKFVLRLHGHFPYDIGLFSAYLLNHLILEPFEAVYLPAGLPHAYIQGDCVECMACSDNVIRAGFTPKHKDVPTLCALVDCTSFDKSEVLRTREIREQGGLFNKTLFSAWLYSPPPSINDFSVMFYEGQVEDPSYEVILEMHAVHSASIAIVTDVTGNARALCTPTENLEKAFQGREQQVHPQRELSLIAGSIFLIAAENSVTVRMKCKDEGSFPAKILIFRAFCQSPII